MDGSLLPGLLGAYGSEDEADDADLQQIQPAEVSGRQDVADEGGLNRTADQPALVTTVSASLSLPLNAAPEVMDISESGEAAAADVPLRESGGAQEDVQTARTGPDPFWLPPEIAQAPEQKCAPDVQEKVKEYIQKQQETGNTITSSLKSLSGYKNPDFLQHCVKYDNIDQYGSCYPREIFDPTNLPEEDYYDRLAFDWEERQQVRRTSQRASLKSEFVSRGVEQARSIPGGLAPGANAASMVAQAKAIAANSRASKWDTRRQ